MSLLKAPKDIPIFSARIIKLFPKRVKYPKAKQDLSLFSLLESAIVFLARAMVNFPELFVCTKLCILTFSSSYIATENT